MQTKTEVFDLKKAKLALESNPKFERGAVGTNRPMSLSIINAYARQMLLGSWAHTHQGIGFDINGKLADGQHRLMALVVAAEEGVQNGNTFLEPNPKLRISFQVTYGLDEDVFAKLDTGRTRDSRQILAMRGYSDESRLSASARLLFLFDNYDYTQWNKIRVTNQQVFDTVEEYKLEEYLPIANFFAPIGMIASAAIVGYYVCYRAWPDGAKHDAFVEAVTTGVGFNKIEDPRLALRNYITRSKPSKGSRRNGQHHLALYIKASNDYLLGHRRSVVVWRSTEKFPKPVELTEEV